MKWDADRIGILASLTCAVHCAVTALLPALTLAIGVLADPSVETLLVLLALGIAAFSLARGYRVHRNSTPLLGCIGAVAALGLARLGEPIVGKSEAWLSVLAACILVSAHLLNLRAIGRACSTAPVASDPLSSTEGESSRLIDRS